MGVSDRSAGHRLSVGLPRYHGRRGFRLDRIGNGVVALVPPFQPRSGVSKVLQCDGSPDWYPALYHLWRCSDVPWVNWLSLTRPPPRWDWM
jgi:hypothetical protein